jgi:hypothetical protein
LATDVQNIFLTKKEKLTCMKCNTAIPKGAYFVAENENYRGTCFQCSPFKSYAFLPPGDAALTRRSKKHSTLCGVVQFWNQRRKRYERKGQFVTKEAIDKARTECEADQIVRAKKNEKAAVIREVKDKEYIQDFALAIRNRYPNCPPNREVLIAKHACEKHSGRVGRTAAAKEFSASMIDLAVEAHIRHTETSYDNEFGKGKLKREIRSELKTDINQILLKWRRKV